MPQICVSPISMFFPMFRSEPSAIACSANHSIWINPNEFNSAFKRLHPLDTKYNDDKPHFLLHFPLLLWSKGPPAPFFCFENNSYIDVYVLQPTELVQCQSPISRLKATTTKKTKQNKKGKIIRTTCSQAKRGRRRTRASGLLSRIASILSIISGVNFGITSTALRLSKTCSGLDAPRMTVDVFGFFANHASASWETLQLSSVRHQIGID